MRNDNRGMTYVLGYVLVVIVGVLAMGGCASISTFQTARTLKPGETQKGFAITAGNPRISESWGAGGVQEFQVEGSPILPWPEFWFRKGLSENLDWGIKTWGPFFGAIADLKYRFLSDKSPWQVAGSLGLGFSNRLETLEESFAFFDFHLPFFISRDFGKHSSFYISPKYIHRVVIGAYPSCNAFGGGLGVSFHLSKKLSMMVEYDCVYEKGTVEGFTHNWGVGFAFNKQKK